MTEQANILLIGGGAVGTMTAYALEAGGLARVTMVLRSNYERVKDAGFCIDSIDHGSDIVGWRPTQLRDNIPDVAKERLEPFDFVIVCTKNVPDVPPTVGDLVSPTLTKGRTSVVLIQNGLNIEKPLQRRFPGVSILSSVQLIGAEEKQYGTISQTEPDISWLGPFTSPEQDKASINRDTQIAQRFVHMYNACGKVQCHFDDNVRYNRWRKLLYNSSYNSVSAVLRMDVTRMRIWDHIIDDLVLPIMREIINIAAADGIELSQDLPSQVVVIDKLESWVMPSMGQDAVKGNLIELENIVGEPVREAQRLGVPCPTLITMYGILKGIQNRTMESRGLLTPKIENVKVYR